MTYQKENIILEKTFKFSLRVIEFVEELETQRKWVLANQLLKSATSIGANVKEAQSAESKKDFIHKLKIAAKEADETEYWLMLCRDASSYPYNEALMEDLISVKKLLSRIISSSKTTLAH